MNKLKLLTVLGSFSAGVDPGPYEEEIARLEAELAEKEQRLIELQNELNTAEGEIAEQAATIAALQQDISDLNTELESLRAQIELLNTTISELQATIQDKDEQLEQAREDIENLSTRIEELSTQVSNLQAQIVAKDVTIAEQAAQIEELESEIEDLKVPFGYMVIGGNDGNYTQVDLNSVTQLDTRIIGNIPADLTFENLTTTLGYDRRTYDHGSRASSFSNNSVMTQIGTAENPAFPNLTGSMECAFENDTALTHAYISGAPSIANYAFKGCSNLEHVKIDLTKSTSTIDMFRNDTSLVSLEFKPDEYGCIIGSIEYRIAPNCQNMFDGCTSLNNFGSLGEMPTIFLGSDARYMFANCTSLGSFYAHIQAGTGTVNADYMFYNCTSLTDVNFEEYTFNCSTANNAFTNCRLNADSAIRIADAARYGSKNMAFGMTIFDMSTVEEHEGVYYITEDFYNNCYKVLDTDKSWALRMNWVSDMAGTPIDVITEPYVPETGYYPNKWVVDTDTENNAETVLRRMYNKSGGDYTGGVIQIDGYTSSRYSACGFVMAKGDYLINEIGYTTIPNYGGSPYSVNPKEVYLFTGWCPYDTENDAAERLSAWYSNNSELNKVLRIDYLDATRAPYDSPSTGASSSMTNQAIFIEGTVIGRGNSGAARVTDYINTYGSPYPGNKMQFVFGYQLGGPMGDSTGIVPGGIDYYGYKTVGNFYNSAKGTPSYFRGFRLKGVPTPGPEPEPYGGYVPENIEYPDITTYENHSTFTSTDQIGDYLAKACKASGGGRYYIKYDKITDVNGNDLLDENGNKFNTIVMDWSGPLEVNPVNENYYVFNAFMFNSTDMWSLFRYLFKGIGDSYLPYYGTLDSDPNNYGMMTGFDSTSGIILISDTILDSGTEENRSQILGDTANYMYYMSPNMDPDKSSYIYFGSIIEIGIGYNGGGGGGDYPGITPDMSTPDFSSYSYQITDPYDTTYGDFTTNLVNSMNGAIFIDGTWTDSDGMPIADLSNFKMTWDSSFGPYYSPGGEEPNKRSIMNCRFGECDIRDFVRYICKDIPESTLGIPLMLMNEEMYLDTGMPEVTFRGNTDTGLFVWFYLNLSGGMGSLSVSDAEISKSYYFNMNPSGFTFGWS